MVLHPIQVPLPIRDLRFVASEISVVLAIVLFALARRRLPAVIVAFSCYALIVAPVLGFVQTGSQLVAARYSYLACIPLTLLAGGAVLRVAQGMSASSSDGAHGGLRTKLGAGLLLLAGVLLVPLGFATANECRVWHDTFSLWKHDLSIDPKDNAARRNLILAYLDQGRAASDPVLRTASLESALEQCRQGLEQGPDAAYYSHAAKVYDLIAADKPAERRRHLELALDQARRGIEIVEHSSQRLPEIYESCGVILCKLDRPGEAVPYLEKLVAADATSANRYGMLADALLQCGRAREALVPLEAALRLAPDTTAIWLELGDARRKLGDHTAAIEAYRRVLDLTRRRLGPAAATDDEFASAQQAIEALGSGR
jgi:tetratricopeptide (TPR) repeat protein